jgi:hypothetical protein
VNKVRGRWRKRKEKKKTAKKMKTRRLCNRRGPSAPGISRRRIRKSRKTRMKVPPVSVTEKKPFYSVLIYVDI